MDIQPFLVAENVRSTGWFRPELVLTLGTLALFTLAGQLIVFETLSALAYAFLLRQQWPVPATLAGVVLLVAGVLWALRVRPEAVTDTAH